MIKAQIAERLVVQCAAEQVPIRRTARVVLGADGHVERMRPEQRVRLAQGVGAVAGPAVMRRIGHQAGAHRVQLDVALAEQQVGLGLHQGPTECRCARMWR